MTYDADNRVSSVINTNGTESYTYDITNRRVTRTRGSTDVFFYGVMGELLGRYRAKTYQRLNGEEMFFYFGGRMVTRRDGSAGMGGWSIPSNTWMQAIPPDRLSSIGGGSAHYPYGEEKTSTANDKHKFATYYRDSLSGLISAY